MGRGLHASVVVFEDIRVEETCSGAMRGTVDGQEAPVTKEASRERPPPSAKQEETEYEDSGSHPSHRRHGECRGRIED